MASSTTTTPSKDIDHLLQQYLSLLDQYNNLRAALGQTQSSLQQLLARANFEAPRGVRYGKHFYDSRMQASTLCCVAADPGVTAGITISTVSSHEAEEDNVTEGEPKEERGAGEGSISTSKQEETKTSAAVKKGKDPIRMFGVLTPQSLRLAQGEAISLLRIVPQLLQIDAEMNETEIQIRRVRKKRAKVEALEKKEGATTSQTDTPISVDDLKDRIGSIQV